MIHKYRIVIECQFDDENGEYSIPHNAYIERLIGSAIYQPLSHLGFDKEQNVEAERLG